MFTVRKRRGVCIRGGLGWADPPPRYMGYYRIRSTSRAVRILLEYILVYKIYFHGKVSLQSV